MCNGHTQTPMQPIISQRLLWDKQFISEWGCHFKLSSPHKSFTLEQWKIMFTDDKDRIYWIRSGCIICAVKQQEAAFKLSVGTRERLSFLVGPSECHACFGQCLNSQETHMEYLSYEYGGSFAEPEEQQPSDECWNVGLPSWMVTHWMLMS